MSRPVRLQTLAPAPVVRKVDEPPRPSTRQALDVLIITLGDDEQFGPGTWKKTCESCQLSYRHLRVDQAPGQTDEEKTESFLVSVRQMAQAGKIDALTQVMVMSHGGQTNGQLELIADARGVKIRNGVFFLQSLRAMLSPEPGKPWPGVLYSGACGGGNHREDFEEAEGYTTFFSGKKSVRIRDVVETFDHVLRAWSKQARESGTLTAAQLAQLQRTTHEHCGEHIAWCGQNSVRVHQAGRVPFDDLPHELPHTEKRTRVLYAKLSHGSAKAVKRVVGRAPEHMLAPGAQAWNFWPHWRKRPLSSNP